MKFIHPKSRWASELQNLADQCFEEYQTKYLSILIFHYKIPKAEAEDLFVDVFLKFREKLLESNFGVEKPETFFSIMIGNAAKNYLKAPNKPLFLEDADVADEALPNTNDKVWDVVSACVEKMSVECQQILRMYFYENKTWFDIAYLLKISPATMTRKKEKCFAELKDFLKEDLSRFYSKMAEDDDD